MPAAMVSFDEALRIILDSAKPLPAESAELTHAHGRVAAEDIVADADLVPYARSAMDGYAVRAEETRGAASSSPVRIPVTGKVLAEAGEAALAPGTAMSITTGAPLPHGADVVIPHENVERAGDAILISAPVEAGDSVFPPAEDMRRGDVLVGAGELLHPATLALLAFVGRSSLRVYRRPRVALVCTGSELVDVSATPARGQIRNSNAHMLSALVRRCGAEMGFCETATDERGVLESLLETARARCDLLITTGGASTGERDLVKETLLRLGAQLHFRSVSVRPGKPAGFATWSGAPVCILPGNPAAAFVGFHEFVRPALLRMAGRSGAYLPRVEAVLRSAVKSKALHRYFLLAQLTVTPKGFEVTPLANQCSVLVRTSAEANALIVLPEGAARYELGERVAVEVLDWERVVPANAAAADFAAREAFARK